MVFFKLFLRFLSSSGTCGSSGEWQPDHARPMDEFGTVVTLWDHLASIGIRVWSQRKRDQSVEKNWLFFLTLLEILAKIRYLWKLWRVAA